MADNGDGADVSATTPEQLLSVLCRAVSPRPIAWLSAPGRDGACVLIASDLYNMIDGGVVAVGLAPVEGSGAAAALEAAEAAGSFVVSMPAAQHRDQVAFSLKAARGDAAHATASSAGVDPLQCGGGRLRIAGAPVALELDFLRRERLPQRPGGPPQVALLGRIVRVHLRRDCMDENGMLDPFAMRTLCIVGEGTLAVVEKVLTMPRPTKAGTVAGSLCDAWSVPEPMSRGSEAAAAVYGEPPDRVAIALAIGRATATAEDGLEYSSFGYKGDSPDPRDAFPHNPTKQFVMPRPIGWIGTYAHAEDGGVANLSPYSFFGLLALDPPVVFFCASPDSRTGTNGKDALYNASRTGVFAHSLCEEVHAQAMNASAAGCDPDDDEFTLAGLSVQEGERVPAPCVAEASAHVECQHLRTIADGYYSTVLGTVVAARARGGSRSFLGRMGYMDYAVLRSKGGADDLRWVA